MARFISNNFFFISTLILGMAASYFIEVYIRRVIFQRIKLAQEEEKSNRLLLNVLPREIAATLKEREGIIAEHYDNASILFADLADFTPFSASMTPHEVVGLLNEIFSTFDDLAAQYGLEKIKTIGDCYMLASGVPRGRHDHAQVIARVGLAMLDSVEGRSFGGGRRMSLRIGNNSGPVVAGVIGRKKYIYDLWGDTVNVASRMKSHGASGSIQITDSVHELIKNNFVCEPKGSIYVKGKGLMPVWHVVAEKKALKECNPPMRNLPDSCLRMKFLPESGFSGQPAIIPPIHDPFRVELPSRLVNRGPLSIHPLRLARK